MISTFDSFLEDEPKEEPEEEAGRLATYLEKLTGVLDQIGFNEIVEAPLEEKVESYLALRPLFEERPEIKAGLVADAMGVALKALPEDAEP